MTLRSFSWMRFALGKYGFAALGLAVVTLMVLCYRAVNEWQHSARMLADRRAQTTVDLLVTAFTRDMRGAQMNVLAPVRLDEPSDLNDRVTSGFARYPYPEVFVAWRDTATPASMVFYSRSGRHPSWLPPDAGTQYLPVATSAEPATSARLADQFSQDAARHHRFSIFNLDIGATRYQVVTLLTYGDLFREHVTGAFGFMVNLDWVRQHYFQDLTTQVAGIAGIDEGMALEVRDDQGNAIVRPDPGVKDSVISTRVFSLTFFDPIVAGIDPIASQVGRPWRAEAIVSADPALVAATAGARRTLIIAFGAALLLVVTYAVIIRAVRENSRIADTRSAFVATVTHELKTPLATIRAIGETFASGQQTTLEMSREFAKVSVDEAKRLTRLIDNLLAYSRVTDVTEVYQFEAVSPDALIDETLHEFSPQLARANFDLQRDIPSGLPRVWVDRTSIRLMLGNLLDNAIRYAGNTPRLALRAHPNGKGLTIEVEDHGIGIPESEIPHITRKFFRGHSAGPGGSGLGLAIVERIVADHGGVLTITSTVGVGTRVAVTLPLAGSHG